MKTTILSAILLLLMMGTSLPKSFANNNLIVCNGDSVKVGIDSLPASFISGNQNLTVRWNGTVFSDQRIKRFVKPNSNAVYILEITKGSNIYKDTFNVTVRPKPVSPIIDNDTTVFYGDCFILDFNKSKPAGSIHSWSTGLNDTTLRLYALKDTSYKLTITNGNGCSRIVEYSIHVSNYIYISVKDTLKFRNSRKINGNVITGHRFLDSLFRKYEVKNVEKVKFINDKSIILNKLYRFYGKGNMDSLYTELSNFDSLFTNKRFSKPGQMRSSGTPTYVAPGFHPNDWTNQFTPHALAALRMPEAWSITHGDPSIRIAIIEVNGFPKMDHEDLSGKVVIHTFNIPYTIDGHATQVAGCITAKPNNNLGVSGAGFDIGVTAFYMAPSNIQAFEQILQAIYNDGIRIVSMSFDEGCDGDPGRQELFDIYHAKGLVFFAAGGNGDQLSGGVKSGCPDLSNDYRKGYVYPASYNNVISVGGVATETVSVNPTTFIRGGEYPGNANPGTITDYTVNFNNLVHGPSSHTYNDKIDFCAPSVKVKTTGDMYNFPNTYNECWGTSFGAPLAASVFALIKSANPCLVNDQIEVIMKSSARHIADDISSNPWYNKLGAGFIDAKAALDMATNSYGTSNLVVQNQSLQINNTTLSYANITVESGGVLSLFNCNVYMANGGTILVKKGGRFIAGNCLITMNYAPGICNSTGDWAGIIIEGSPNKEQGSYLDHGIVNLNKTTVNYARTSVTVGAGNPSGGGQIIASDCNFTFRNAGITFNPYSSPSGLNNMSVINRCNFNIPFKYPSITAPFSNMIQVGINVNGIKGLKINGCKFAGDDLNGFVGIAAYDRQAIGINSFNSSLTVQDDKAVVFPPKKQTIGLFQYLDKGIYHVSTSADNNIDVNTNLFSVCATGIKLDGGSSSKIYRNTFQFSLNGTVACSLRYKEVGIATYNSIGIVISENITDNILHSKTGLDDPNCRNRGFQFLVGSVVNNTANPIKLSTIYSYNKLNYPMTSSQFEVDNTTTVVRCNEYFNHFDAITVYGKNPDFGSCSNPDNRKDRMNLFTNFYFAGDVCNYNVSGNSFNYLISPVNPKPPVNYGHILPATSVNLISSCASGTIDPIGCIIKDAPPLPGGILLRGNMGGVLDLFEQMKLKKALLNSGGTNALNQAVINGSSINAPNVYNSLASASPYLSDEVLNSVLSYAGYFSASQIADILVSNSALSNTLYQAALNNSQLLSDGNAMTSMVNAQANPNLRLALEWEINFLTNSYYEARTTFVDSVLYLHSEDTINNANNFYLNQLIAFLENQVDEDNKYVLLPLYCATKNSTKISAQSVLFSNSNSEEKAYKDVVLFNYDVMRGIADSIYLAGHYNRILEIANDTTLFASPTANGLLEMVYKEVRYRNPFGNNESNLGKRMLAVKEPDKESVSKIRLYPNPTDGLVTLTFSNPDIITDAIIKVVNMDGIEIIKTGFDDHKNVKVLNLSSHKNGIYFVKVILTDGNSYSEKLVYVK